MECNQAASDRKTVQIQKLANALNAARDTIRDLERSVASTNDEDIRLRQVNGNQETSLWRFEQAAANSNHVNEAIHCLTAAGGLRMVVSVLCVGLLALDFGVNLADLGIDHLKFESYYAFAEAQMQGLAAFAWKVCSTHCLVFA